MHVLLVDDEEDFISALAERLSFRGIEADWVTDGNRALSQISENDYQVAVLDIKMPGLSGIELGKKIHETHPDIKLIFCTGHGSIANFQEGAAQSGPRFYLTKPINIDTLILKMNELIA